MKFLNTLFLINKSMNFQIYKLTENLDLHPDDKLLSIRKDKEEQNKTRLNTK